MSLLKEIHSIEKVVGGIPAPEGRFNFQVAVFNKDPEVVGYKFVGGSLIAPNVVLTSWLGAYSVTEVALGCVDIVNSSSCELIEVVEVLDLADFNVNMTGNYLSLLVLKENSVQTPVAIAAPGFDLKAGQDLTITGWGTFNQSTKEIKDGILLEANVEAIGHETCDNRYKDMLGIQLNVEHSFYSQVDARNKTNLDNTGVKPFNGTRVTEYMFCSSGGGSNTCRLEDLGGPIFLRCDATGLDLQVGVHYFGCGDDIYPRVYYPVFHPDLFAFIESVVASQGHSLTTFGSTAEFCVVGGTQPSEELSDPPTPFPTFDITAWTCGGYFFAGRDGCDCNCGIPDPDCEFDNVNVFNCEAGQICVDALCVLPGEDTTSPTMTPTSTPTISPMGSPSSTPQASETSSPTSRDNDTRVPTFENQQNATETPTFRENDTSTPTFQEPTTSTPTYRGTGSYSPTFETVTKAPTSQDNSGVKDFLSSENIVVFVAAVVALLVLVVALAYFKRTHKHPVRAAGEGKQPVDGKELYVETVSKEMI